jgi:Arc/MetJ family transcription regulator
VIFKAVGDNRPYPDHGYTTRQWSGVPPRLVRLDELVTTKRELDLQMLLSEDSTFYGDLFAHVVEWQGTLYLEDGLHRGAARRAAPAVTTSTTRPRAPGWLATVAGATLVKDTRADASVDLVLGSGYKEMATSTGTATLATAPPGC